MVPDEHIGQWSNDRNCSRLRGRERLAKQIPCFTASLQEAEWPADPHKSCMLNEDFTEVEWVRQTDQVLVIKDRCSARVADWWEWLPSTATAAPCGANGTSGADAPGSELSCTWGRWLPSLQSRHPGLLPAAAGRR